MKSYLSNKYAWATFLLSFTIGSGSLYAAPGQIDNSPLFLQSAVQPNIFFMVDDSGSMDWEVLKSKGAIDVHGTGTNSGNMDFTPNNSTEIRELCAGYNVMAYNPDTKYTPWKGVDENGYTYSNKSLTTALHNPYDNDDIDNISSHFYIVWNDADNDKVYDNGDCAVPTNYGTTLSASECTTKASTCFAVSSLSSGDQQNYANWYTYYRKREFVAKKALSEIISRSKNRMGLGTLHNNNSVNTQIKDVDDISTPIDTTAETNKIKLMDELFNINSSGGTPLRQSLEDVGEYYRGSGGLFSGASTPILSEADGGECQQNFAVLMSDGFWNGEDPNAGNADGDNNTVFDGGDFADTHSNTLADVAMKYYETDLSNLANKVPETGLDNNDTGDSDVDEENDMHQHMVTYTVAFGVEGTLTCDPTDSACTENWTDPDDGDEEKIDDMQHAAANGRGIFLSAGDPEGLISTLGSAIADIAARTGTASAVSFNSTSVRTDSQAFQAEFNSSTWYGNLKAFSVDSSGIGAQVWETAKHLDNRNLTVNPRNIITYNGTKGIPFAWPAQYTSLDTSAGDLDDLQVADLLVNAPFPVSTTDVDEIAKNTAYGQSILAYLRGFTDDEGTDSGQFRERNGHRLGDIVHSSPAYVQTPDARYPDDIEGADLYSTFKAAQASRQGRVYVGANDGMLHVFDAGGVGTDGEEVFAYIPGLVFSSASGEGLHALAEQSYIHRYYVDLTPSVADVFVNGAWKTYLVGGLRAGGKGVFALDITNPSYLTEANAANVVKWEFTHDDLGYTFSDIQIGRMANGKWAAIFGNGYNNDPNGDGRAKLFIKYLDNSGMQLIDTGVGSMTNDDCQDTNSDCNGLSSPELADLNGDGIIDRIYAGDLHGNMWVFDVDDSNALNWTSAYKNGSDSIPLFEACTSTPCTAVNRQPITSKPSLARHPTKYKQATAPNIMVFFGTGQYLTASDNNSSATQTFYGVWDGGSFDGHPRNSALKRSDLVEQTLTNQISYKNAGEPDEETAVTRDVTDLTVNYDPNASSAEYGWRIDLIDSKERVVVESVAVGDIIFFNTLTPSSSTCSGGGGGWLMNLDLENGGLPSFAVADLFNDGYLSAPIVGGQEVEGIPTASSYIDIGDGVLYRVIGKSDGEREKGKVRGGDTKYNTRTSWTHLQD